MSLGLSILIPVCNERRTIEAAIADALKATLPVSRELVIVDDGSDDGTTELLRSKTWPNETKIVFRDRNRGKGAAVRTALGHPTGRFAAVLDADLEYRAADLAPMLKPLLSGETNLVFGTRACHSHMSYGFWYVIGNKVVSFVTNALYDCWISDVMTCHRGMRTDLFAHTGTPHPYAPRQAPVGVTIAA